VFWSAVNSIIKNGWIKIAGIKPAKLSKNVL